MTAVNPLGELVTALEANRSATNRIGKVVSVDKVSTTAWLLNVQVGADPTPRPMRWQSSGHQPQVGERVIWTDDGTDVPVVLGRASSSAQAMNFGTGAVTGASFTDATGNLRDGLTAAAASVAAVDADVTALETWRTGTVTPTLSNVESRISTLESWRTGTVTPTLASHATSIATAATNISTLQSWRTSTVDPTLNSHTSTIADLSTIAGNHNAAINDILARMAAYGIP